NVRSLAGWKACPTVNRFSAHESLRPILHALVACGSAAAALHFSDLDMAHEAEVNCDIRSIALAGKSHSGRFTDSSKIATGPVCVFGSVPHSRNGASAMGILLGRKQATRIRHRCRN